MLLLCASFFNYKSDRIEILSTNDSHTRTSTRSNTGTKQEREDLFLHQSKEDATGSLVVTTLIASAGLGNKRSAFMTSLYQNLVEKDNTASSFEILLTNITAAISSSNTYHDNIKLLFKGYHYAVNAKKGHEDLVLKFINIALRKNRCYYRCMESLTEYLLRMVRRNKSMREIMKEEDWKWLLDWWKENDVRPTMYQDTSAGVSLLKPGHPSSYGSHYSSSWDYRDRDDFRDTEMIRQRLERLLRAEKDEDEEDMWDSDDDGTDIIGRHICVDNKSVWKIIEFDKSRGKHLLLNGSGQKWEKIGVGVCKRWTFCDHLVDVSSSSSSSAGASADVVSRTTRSDSSGTSSSSCCYEADADEKEEEEVDVSII